MNCSAKIGTACVLDAPKYMQEEEWSIRDEWGTSFKEFYRVVVHNAKDMQHRMGVPVYVFFYGDVDAGILVTQYSMTVIDFKRHTCAESRRGKDA